VGGFGAEIRKGLDVDYFHSPAHSQKLYKSLKILGSKVPLSGHLEALSNDIGAMPDYREK
jgi:hypothetical protein